MTLTPLQARKFYNRFGNKQDTQSFYEDAALDDLVAHAKFDEASSVLEVGCGTGRFASRLLAENLPESATYVGIDISETMVDLARRRISRFGERVRVDLSDGAMAFSLADHSVNRVVATYVLDLLSERDIQLVIVEAKRLLMPTGKLCLIGLTKGTSTVSRIVSSLWTAAFRLHASLVGGCRPILVESFLAPSQWTLEYRNVIVQFGVPSEVLIAVPTDSSDNFAPCCI